MTRKVRSYVFDHWFTADGPGKVMLDPTTGEPVAEVTSEGLDTSATVRHAREVGGPALRALSFPQRAQLLKDLAAYLQEHTKPIYDAYATTGATRDDAAVDVDGGILTLASFASIGKKGLPNSTMVVLDEPQRLTKNPLYLGQTVLTAKPGVMVQVNAYNFPVWGMLEKLGPAILAGLPSIVKPASQTAHIAEMVFEQIIESGILPAGAVQLVCGKFGDLDDDLGGFDHISFTGSADTAGKIRSMPAVAERGCHFNAEADSLNSAVLGPDATKDTEEFGLFVKSVVREMTAKSGQKCTAIRRAFVPNERIDDVLEALREALGAVVLGDPRDESTTMGPLVSAAQRADVLGIVEKLSADAEIVVGGPGAEVPTIDGDADKTGFVAPTVLRAKDPRSATLNTLEPFGPVATVFGYTDVEDLVDLVELGEGSLVASVVSYDKEFVANVVSGIANHHGRVMVMNRDIARGSTPHGTTIPTLIHGGPGRAGGGEELGGVRGVHNLMQATSLHGPADMLVEITQVWNKHATQLDPGVHVFRLHLDEVRLGDTLHTASRTITLADIEHFAEFTGDTFYAHMNEEAAAASPIFKGRVAHGYFVIAAAAGLFVDPDPGPVLANFGLDNLRFVQPVYPDDTISLRMTCKKKVQRPSAGWGEVTWDVEVRNQNDEIVATYDLLTINAAKQAS